MINILQILRNNARTFARLDINSDFTMEKYRSCKYARRNSGRGMYVSASSSELGGSGYVKYEVWYSLEIPLFMNKCPKRSELRRGQRFAFCSSINYPHLHLTRHTFLQAKSHLSLSVPTNNEQTLWERSMCRPLATWLIRNG